MCPLRVSYCWSFDVFESPIVGALMYYSFILLLDTLHITLDMSSRLSLFKSISSQLLMLHS